MLSRLFLQVKLYVCTCLCILPLSAITERVSETKSGLGPLKLVQEGDYFAKLEPFFYFLFLYHILQACPLGALNCVCRTGSFFIMNARTLRFWRAVEFLVFASDIIDALRHFV